MNWIDVNLPWVKYSHKDGSPIIGEDSFCKRGLNNPGILLETDKGEFFLIGSVNSLGGTCDCCAEFDENTMVKRYCRLARLDIFLSQKGENAHGEKPTG